LGAAQAQQVTVTSYSYDALGQITQVKDAKGNVTKVEYDGLGRRTVIDNPDTGRVESQYDLAGNLIKKITAELQKKGAAIEYRYDYSRLVSIQHPLYPDANVTYTYGTEADKAKNQAGRIKTVQHQAGVEEREYGTLGEVIKETLRFTGLNGPAPSYTTRYDFDSFGRLHQVLLP
ncbi:hypothetical protein ACQV5M_20950, partial [Leptospira sp. SA-E8]|uniref:hypothetical protein n=1 Tax=Leptospira sp. SA-E8 TaxID=3422259 RepID=UPI003EB69C2B